MCPKSLRSHDLAPLLQKISGGHARTPLAGWPPQITQKPANKNPNENPRHTKISSQHC